LLVTQVLVVYRRSTGELVEAESLGDDFAAASKTRFARELSERGDPDVEVVLLSSSSDAAMQRTHSRYFKDLRQLWSEIGAAATGTDVTAGNR
jgi:hypothetical protein